MNLCFFSLFQMCFHFQRKYTQKFEDTKDQIYFMQTETPVYETQKKARIAASEVSRKRWMHSGIVFVIGPPHESVMQLCTMTKLQDSKCEAKITVYNN